jgi:outer membrane protein assembly factor BamA
VAGQRYRLDVSPTLGTLSYQTVLADYRRYFFLNPLTIAFRGMHYGRYGRNASGATADGEQLLYPLFLGQEYFLRGYASESFGPEECSGTSCDSFEKLWGNRIAVASAELRIPLFGVSEFGLINMPFLPTEVSPFFDIGYAWGDVSFAGIETAGLKREVVYSAGLSARMNVLGYLVLETYLAYPFQRQQKGWHVGFNLMPGW